MSETFPRVSFLSEGYDTELVDQFFADARKAYEGGVPAEQFSSEQVRQATFSRKRHGYDVSAVDAAMNRLEIAFIQRDREDHVAVNGEEAWLDRAAERATTLYPRLLRPHGQRFAHPKGVGYHIHEVDGFLDELADFFDDRAQITSQDAREIIFPLARGKNAYDEGVVDAYLARVIEILLAIE